MITSNINEILHQIQISKKEEQTKTSDKFLKSIEPSKDDKIVRNDELSYKNIKGISLEEIDEIFTNDEDKQMAKNLRLATLFTKDESLSKALFNTVLGQPFDLGYNFLSNRYNEKSIFLNNKPDDLSSMLHKYITNKDDSERKPYEKVSQQMLDDILLEVNSFNFLDAMSNNSKNQYDRYNKEQNNQYSFLYNNTYLEYQKLIAEYKKEEANIDKILSQL